MAAERKPGRARLPVFTSLRGYRAGWLRGDAVAGLTVWAVLVPEALPYASIAGVSPVVGLYAAPGALIFYAAFGSSRHLVVGPMAATAALSAAAVGQVAAGKSGAFAAKTYAARDGYQIDANRELIGLGTANLASGLSSGMVVNGSLSKTAVNGSAGARTQASGLVVAVLTVITLLFLTGLFEDLAEATLAAVVIAALIELVDHKALAALWRAWSSRLGKIYGFAARADFIAALAAMLGVLIFDTLPGLLIGVLDSVLLLVYRVSRPHVAVLGQIPGSGGQWADTAVHPEDQTVPGITVLRVEAGLFFANADHVHDAIADAAAADGTRAVVLDCQTTPSVDVTAARMLNQLAADLGKRGVRLVLAGEIGQVRDMLAAVAEEGRTPEYHRTVDDAVTAARTGPAVEPAREE